MSRVSRLVFKPSIEGSLALAMRAIAGGIDSIAGKPVPALAVAAAAELNNHLIVASVAVPEFWNLVADEILIGTPMDDAINAAIGTAAGSFLQDESIASGVNRRMRELVAHVNDMFPKLDQQLPLRIGPLRSQWDTYGPGMLKHIERQIWNAESPSDFWLPAVTSRMVHPVRGGAGEVCCDGDSFWIEAMLTNDHPTIPEVLRAIWLTTRVAIDSHLRSRSGMVNVRRGWAWASVAFVLAAAHEVGVTAEKIPVADAMRHWQFGDTEIATRVQSWWETRDQSVPMPMSIQSLVLTS